MENPSSSSRLFVCKNSPDNFCYICGLFTSASDRRTVSDEIRKLYFDYFRVHINQDNKWQPNYICSTCRKNLHRWSNGDGKMTFGAPMLWREQFNHENDCYFCLSNIKGATMAKRQSIVYANVSTVTKTVLHSDALPVPPLSRTHEFSPQYQSSSPSQASSGNLFQPKINDNAPILFKQADLDDFVRELNLSKSLSELAGSRLKDRKMLAKGIQLQ